MADLIKTSLKEGCSIRLNYDDETNTFNGISIDNQSKRTLYFYLIFPRSQEIKVPPSEKYDLVLTTILKVPITFEMVDHSGIMKRHIRGFEWRLFLGT
jgi:hypothetical protein